MNKSNQG